MSKPAVPLRELVRSNVEVHGLAWAAEHASKRIPFSLFYWLVFGCAPRKLVSKPF
jgi:hypothetical protein